MSNTFEDMTNAELKEACTDFGLEVKAANPGKPNKAEYLVAINEFKANQDKINGKADDEVTNKTVKPKTVSKVKLLKLDKLAKEFVIVHDQSEGQTKEEYYPVTWGNRAIGETQFIALTGEAQWVTRGALGNLRDTNTVIHKPKPNGGVQTITKPRFIIVPQTPPTKEELAELATKQRIRNAKVD